MNCRQLIEQDVAQGKYTQPVLNEQRKQYIYYKRRQNLMEKRKLHYF